MTILLIEDELPAARRLAKLLEAAMPAAQLEGPLEGLEATRAWAATHAVPDLVFCDIHLADGSAFELLHQTDFGGAPVIFTTAYDAYALEAFKTSGVDYLLKPVKPEDLERALRKVADLRKALTNPPEGGTAAGSEPPKPDGYRTRFAVRLGERLLTVMVEDLAYCFTDNKTTLARTFDGRTYPLDQNLDALEGQLDPGQFFRLNRQYLIHIKAIAEMRTHTKARVIVTLQPPAKEAPVVSSERAAAFKAWIGGE